MIMSMRNKEAFVGIKGLLTQQKLFKRDPFRSCQCQDFPYMLSQFQVFKVVPTRKGL